MSPHTTKRTTNLKTKTTRTDRKIKLYGSPTTKELKKKHSSRPVGGAERGRDGQPGREDSQQGSSWRTGAGEVVAGRQGSSWRTRGMPNIVKSGFC